jgi:uncharacterized protein
VIAYVDTSAFVPLLVAEPSTAMAQRLWSEADRVVAVSPLYAEARAALARAGRLGRITDDQLVHVVNALDGLYDQLDVVHPDDALVRHAGDLAERQALRGYDAVHLAAAHRISGADDDVVVIAGDRALLDAAHATGLAVADIAG